MQDGTAQIIIRCAAAIPGRIDPVFICWNIEATRVR